jgi:hypothetical protein
MSVNSIATKFDTIKGDIVAIIERYVIGFNRIIVD